MRFVSFLHEGHSGVGLIRDGRVLDLGAAAPGGLKGLIALGSLAGVAEAPPPGRLLEPGALTFLPVIPDPDKIFCIGLNYDEHRREVNARPREKPTVFTRFAATQLGHRQAAWQPALSREFDYEGELAVVIGRGGRYIPQERALEHVAGYSCYNDFSVRDWQRHTTQFTPGKNFPRSGGFGPWLVTADEIPDPSVLELTTRVNGAVVQHASVTQMLFPVPYLIEYLSSFIELAPGDVIATGTPGGVGARREPPLFLKPADVVEVEICGIGTLVNPVIAEPRGGASPL